MVRSQVSAGLLEKLDKDDVHAFFASAAENSGLSEPQMSIDWDNGHAIIEITEDSIEDLPTIRVLFGLNNKLSKVFGSSAVNYSDGQKLINLEYGANLRGIIATLNTPNEAAEKIRKAASEPAPKTC